MPKDGGSLGEGAASAALTSWPALIAWFFTSRRGLVTLAGVCGICVPLGLALYVGIQQMGYADPLERWLGPRKKPFAGISADAELARCETKAESLALPYVLLSVTSFMRREADPVDPRNYQVASIRTVYTMKLLRDVSAADRVFTEEYKGRSGKLTYWRGSEPEVIESDSTAYHVPFTGKRGSQRTVVTGTNIRYRVPLPDGRSGFNGALLVPPNADFYTYPNSAKDIICELTMVIESQSLSLQPYLQGSYRHDGSQIVPTPVTTAASHSTLTARWTNVLPDEEPGIVFRW